MRTHHYSLGISLLEIAIIVAIIGIMGAFIFSFGKTQLDAASIKASANNLGSVEDALLLFQKKQGRFPCPAIPSDSKTASSYGLEQAGCEAVCPAGIVCGGTAAIGFVPFQTLGIPEVLAIDGWGRRITYAVDIQHTGSSTFATGTIAIVDEADNLITASPAFGKAIFALVSHGPDGAGAYDPSGDLHAECNTAAPSRDAENCDGDDTFRDSRATGGDNVATFHDDAIAWHTQTGVQPSTNTDNEICLANPLAAKTQRFSVGEYGGCYIGNNGQIYCWGHGYYGALAQGGGIAPAKTPIAIQGGINDWISVSVGWRHACAMRSNGHLYCWGRNWYGQVGDGSSTTPSGPSSAGVHVPTEVVGASCGWTQISAHAQGSCGIKTDGRLYCWGRDASMDAVLTPTEIAGEHTDWIFVDGHRDGAVCGIRGSGAAGSLYCWGWNAAGQLGDGSYVDSVVPVQVKDTAGTGAYTDWVSARSETAGTAGVSGAVCGIRSNGSAYCWGSNSDGQLGINVSGGDRNLPTQVRDTAGTGYWEDWTFIKASRQHSCGVRSNGRGYCWGRNAGGVLGIGTSGADQQTPQEVAGGHTNWLTIEPMYSVATCGLRSNDQIYCWGDSWTVGLLGGNQPDNTNYNTPQAVTMPVSFP